MCYTVSSLDPSNRGITAGGPFSAVTSSMWPQDILVKLSEQDDNSDPNHQPDYRYYFVNSITILDNFLVDIKSQLFCFLNLGLTSLDLG